MGLGGPGLSLRGLFVLGKLARFLSGSTIPSLASRTFTASIYHFVQQSTFSIFSKAEEGDSCNLASSPKLKGSSYRRSEMSQP